MDWYGIIKDFAAPTVALIGVGVTGGIALAGLKTFDRWRPEKLEEKRIDVAIEALAIAFEASIVFNDIRSRIMTVHKYADTKTAVTFGITRANAVPAVTPSNAVVIPNDAAGTFQVILESSTDLITWTAANPGSYSGTTQQRFFRTRIVKQQGPSGAAATI